MEMPEAGEACARAASYRRSEEALQKAKETEELVKIMREQPPLSLIKPNEPKVEYILNKLLMVKDLYSLIDKINEHIEMFWQMFKDKQREIESICYADEQYHTEGGFVDFEKVEAVLDADETIQKYRKLIDKYKKYREFVIKQIEALLDTLIEEQDE